MAALGFQHAFLAAVHGRCLRLADGGRGFEGDAEVDGGPIGDAALDSARVVGFGGQAPGGVGIGGAVGGAGDEGVVVDGAGHFAPAEAGADFEAFGGGDAKHGVREHGFELVEARLAETEGSVADHASHGAADAVFGVTEEGDFFGHSLRRLGIGAAHGEEAVDLVTGDGGEKGEEGRVGCCGWVGGRGGEEMFVSNRGDKGDYFHAMRESEIFLCNRTCSYPTNCFPRTTSTSTAAGFDAVFLLVGVVGMARPREHIHGASTVIFWPLVFILDHQTDWCAQGDAKLGAGLDLHSVFFIARSSERALARSSSGHLGLYIGFGQLHSRRAAINDGSYRATM